MLFSSTTFLFAFLPIVLITYYIVPRITRNLVLFIFSLVFYAWGEPVYIVLMIASTIVAYITGLLADKQRKKRKKIHSAHRNDRSGGVEHRASSVF